MQPPRPEEGKEQPRVARTLKRCAEVPSSERVGRPGVGKPSRAAPGNGIPRGCDSLKYFSPRPRRLPLSEGKGKAELRNAAPFISALSRRPRPEGTRRSGERSVRPGPGTRRAPRICAGLNTAPPGIVLGPNLRTPEFRFSTANSSVPAVNERAAEPRVTGTHSRVF